MTSVSVALTDQSACAETLAVHGRSFALASRFLEPERRADAAALYAWCRRADDAVDLPRGSPRRALNELRRELDSIYAGEAQHDPSARAFQSSVHARKIPPEYPSELLNGLEMDVAGVRYETLEDLLLYCHRVAGTVGAMMAHVLGVSDERAVPHAAELGIAMQLTNISRDIHEDWRRGRLYVPRELLAELGLQELPEHAGQPLSAEARRALARSTETLLDHAERWYAAGNRGLTALSFRSELAIRSASSIYSRIGGRVRLQGCDPLAGRAVVPLFEKLALALLSVGRSLLGAPARLIHPHQSVEIQSVTRFPDDILCS